MPTFVSLVGPHLDVTVLVDAGTKGFQRIQNMVGNDLLKAHRLIFADAAAAIPKADIEDLFSPGDYLKLFNKTFGTSIKLNDLPPGDRIVKRLEDLRPGFEHEHGEVADTLLRNYHELTFTEMSLEQFERLFDTINGTMESRSSGVSVEPK